MTEQAVRSFKEDQGLEVDGYEGDGDGMSITAIVCDVDQAALQGIIRQLYSLGLPLISVIFTIY